jgi:UMF1 family MFS transporter
MKFTKEERSWVLYDVANSAFVLIITTTLISIFFKEYAAFGMDESTTTGIWGLVIGFSGAVLAILSPIIGAIADYKGNKKKFFTAAILIGGAATLTLPLIGQGDWVLCIAIYVTARIMWSAANILYDSFLTDVTTNDRMDKLSASGFGWGYIGSVIPFLISIAVILYLQMSSGSTATPPLGMKIAFVIAGLWWLLLSWPSLKNLKQTNYIEPEKNQIGMAFKRLWSTLKESYKYKSVFLFLLAYFFYIDGVSTIITMAAAYGTDLGLSVTMLILFILFIQIVAWPFSILYGWLAGKFSIKTMLMVGIVVYALVTFLAFGIAFIESLELKIMLFWVMSFFVASSQGGIQALSRSYFGKLIPKEKSAEFFGFYNIFGKFAAIFGPIIMGLTSIAFGDSRYGVLSLLIFFVLGGFFLSKIKE